MQLAGGTATTNAFMIKIGSIYIIEFSETGNACYFYSGKPERISERVSQVTQLNDLKNTVSKSYNNKLSHGGNWETRFNEFMRRELGIFPDQKNRSY